MRIGELTREAGVTRKAVRYYEAHGLLTSRRTPSGYRDFDADALEVVHSFERLTPTNDAMPDDVPRREPHCRAGWTWCQGGRRANLSSGSTAARRSSDRCDAYSPVRSRSGECCSE